MTTPRLNRQLTLEAAERVPDGAGGFDESWVALGVLWAAMKARSGRETRATETTVSLVPYQIHVRGAPVGHPERPLPGQRFRDGARIFQIRAVSELDAQGRYLTCFADEEVAL